MLKKIISIATVALLALTGLVAAETSANATGTGYFALDLNNGSAPSNAKGYTVLSGKIYFTADSPDHGRAIYSTPYANPAGATFVTSNAPAGQMSDPRSLFGTSDNLFYWDSPAGYSTSGLFSYKISTSTNSEILSPGGNHFFQTTNRDINMVALGTKVYFIAAESDQSNPAKFWSWDKNTGTVSEIGTLAFAPKPGFGGTSQGMNTNAPGLYVFEGSLYIASDETSWGANDGVLNKYDPNSNTWSTITYNSAVFNGVNLLGIYTYNGQDVLLMARRANGQYNFTFSYMDADELIHPLGSFTSQGAANFINFQGKLIAYINDQLSEVSTVDASLVNLAPTLAPSGTGLWVDSMVQTESTLVLMARVIGNTPEKEHLYKWTGTGAMVQIGTAATLNSDSDFPSFPTNLGSSRIAEMAAIPSGVIFSGYFAAAAGYEPYVAKLDGTLTLLANINSATDGSRPSTGCAGSSDLADYIPASVTSETGVKYIVSEFKSENGALKYSTFETPNINDPCAFANGGNDIYFQGYDQLASNRAVFKMGLDHVITKVGNINHQSYNTAWVYNGAYFFVDYDSNLWMLSADGTTETQLTGTGNDPVSNGGINESIRVANKLVLSAQAASDNSRQLYVLDLTNPSSVSAGLLTDSGNDWRDEVRNLTTDGTKVYFNREPDGNNTAWTGTKIYSLDPSNNAITMVFDVTADDNMVDVIRDLKVVGTTVYAIVRDDNSSDRWMIKGSTSGGTPAVITPASDFRANCLAVVDSKVIVAGQSTTKEIKADNTLGDNILPKKVQYCDSMTSSRGFYFEFPEVDRNGPWGTELGYAGPLVPVAVSRMGQAVTEAPATPFAGDIQTSVDTDDLNLANLDESLDFNGRTGSISFPDGSGFSIDAKGNVKARAKSLYLVQASGKIKFTYTVGSKTKSLTCNVKNFGSTKKLKRALTVRKLYVSATACKLPTPVINAMKTGVVTVVQTLKVKRYYSTTMKAKTPVGGIIKPQNRKMTVRMGKLR